jgi:hypothetical protein
MVHSRLPPELWMIVFRRATDVPSSLNTSPLDALDNSPRSWSEFPSSYDDPSIGVSLKTKARIGLVCKSWRKLFMRILCEKVAIGFPYKMWITLESCFNTFQKMYPDEDALSSAVKYLRFGSEPTTKDDEQAFHSFNRLFPTLKNLQIISIFRFSSISHLITEDGSCGLRHIHWGGAQNDLNELIRFRTNLLKLEVLDLHVCLSMDLNTGESTYGKPLHFAKPGEVTFPVFTL